jgi:predicted esterase
VTSLANNPLIINPNANQAQIIWLHGLGSSPEDFLSFKHAFPQFKFILPQAPMRHLDLWDQSFASWYNVTRYDRHEDFSQNGILDTHQMLAKIVDEIAAPYFIGGFSQGGAQALFSGHRMEQAPLGIIAVSGYRPEHDFEEPNKPPVLLLHGKHDNIIQLPFAENSYRELIKRPSVDLHKFPCDHGWHEDMDALIQAFVDKHRTK